ncbi:alpha/beta fold hydrolase [Cytobacillus sp. FJAT-54145]|uniref:Alpha/beta fold hydrolase n=1 Tax=Cytobacillus spartinae TaxID=3299023 RepID=A0ABW6K9B9_9BACI
MISIFKDDKAEMEYYHFYDKSLEMVGTPYSTKNIQTSFGETHILVFGDLSKKPLLLLHGMTMSSTMWYPNIKHLISERCVFAIDTIGDFGKSKAKTMIKNKKQAAQWLLEVMDGLKLDSCDLGGHSMGGFLALNFAITYPERVSKLLLFAPAATFSKMSPLIFIKIYPALLFHTEKLIDKAFLWFSGTKKPLHPIFRDQVIAGYSNAKPVLRVMPSVFTEEVFQNFHPPTLLLVGENEVIYPARKTIANAKRYIPNLETQIIPGANHSLTIEYADIVNEQIINFLVKNNGNK